MEALTFLLIVVILSQEFQVLVHDQEGEKFSINVTKDTTIGQLRFKLKKVCPDFRDCSRLLFSGKIQTNLEATMRMLGVQSGFTFQYVLMGSCTAHCCKGISYFFRLLCHHHLSRVHLPAMLMNFVVCLFQCMFIGESNFSILSCKPDSQNAY